MTRVCVVGCGWFGRALAQRGVELGWQVWGSVRDAERARELDSIGVRGFGLDLAQEVFPSEPFEGALVVISIAPGRSDERKATYEAGVSRLIAHAFASSARGVALISSTSVYRGLTGHLDELSAPQPEEMLARVERTLTSAPGAVCAVRFAGLVGPERHPGRFLAGREGLENGDHPVNLVARDDCVHALELLLQTSCAEWPRCMNVVAPEHPTRSEFYTGAAKQLGLAPPTFVPGAGGGRTVGCRWLDAQGFRFAARIAEFSAT